MTLPTQFVVRLTRTLSSDPHQGLPSTFVQKSGSGGSAGCGRNDKRSRVYECFWAHFAAEIHLSEKSRYARK